MYNVCLETTFTNACGACEVDTCMTVLVMDVTVGSHQGVFSNAIRISPNPTSDFATVHFNSPPGDKTILKLFDGTGRLVISLPISAGDDFVNVDVSHLPSGVYTVAIENAGAAPPSRFKLAVQH